MITLNEISKTYKSKNGEFVYALKNISLAFPEHGMVFVTGKSGSGKSTLLNLITALDKADYGDIIINNQAIKDFTAKDCDDYRNTYLGIIFQEFNLLEQFSVYENLTLALKIQGKTLDEELIDLTLENVELNGLKHRKCNELSGGQRQRLAIARAIIKNPAVIIADEPTGNLDSSTSKQIFTILQKISSSCLVIIVSHDEESAKKYGDYHVKLEDGEVIESSLPKTNKIEKIKFY